MIRAMLIIGGAALIVGLTLYTFLDAVRTPAHEARTLPKWLWILVTLFARLAEIFEGLPAEAYDENLRALAAGLMLWVRAIDDPLIDDATWVQLTSDEVLDEEDDVVEN